MRSVSDDVTASRLPASKTSFNAKACRRIRQAIALGTESNTHSVTLYGVVWTIRHPPRRADRDPAREPQRPPLQPSNRRRKAIARAAAHNALCEKADAFRDGRHAARIRAALRSWQASCKPPLPPSLPPLPPPPAQQPPQPSPPSPQQQPKETERMDEERTKASRARSSPGDAAHAHARARRSLELPPPPPSAPPSPPFSASSTSSPSSPASSSTPSPTAAKEKTCSLSRQGKQARSLPRAFESDEDCDECGDVPTTRLMSGFHLCSACSEDPEAIREWATMHGT